MAKSLFRLGTPQPPPPGGLAEWFLEVPFADAVCGGALLADFSDWAAGPKPLTGDGAAGYALGAKGFFTEGDSQPRKSPNGVGFFQFGCGWVGGNFGGVW